MEISEISHPHGNKSARRGKMKKHIILVSFLFIFLGFNLQSAAQFTPEELAERAKWEEFLKTAEIIDAKEIGTGVNKPFRLFLKEGEIENSGCWKNPRGKTQGRIEGWQYEIAAYEMDKLLELNMVAPTVERRYKGKRGSLQLWCTFENTLLDVMEDKIPMPQEKLDHLNKMKYVARAFDSLIANDDRTQENIFYTKDWRMLLPDHSQSFRSGKEYEKQLMFGKNGIKGTKLIRQLPRAFVEKVKDLDFESIKAAVGPYLTDKEIKAVLKRKELLLKEIDEMIKEKGEDKFLY